MGSVRAPLPLILVTVLAALAGGCAARTGAAPASAPVELRAPAPPPRVLPAPPDPVEPEATEPAPAAAPAAAPARPATRPASRPPAPDSTPPRSGPARPPALRPGVAPGASATTEAAVLALLEAARRDLSRITPAPLTADARTQYDAASRFAEQADAALKARNLVYAGMLADKAATLAAALLR